MQHKAEEVKTRETSTSHLLYSVHTRLYKKKGRDKILK